MVLSTVGVPVLGGDGKRLSADYSENRRSTGIIDDILSGIGIRNEQPVTAFEGSRLARIQCFRNSLSAHCYGNLISDARSIYDSGAVGAGYFACDPFSGSLSGGASVSRVVCSNDAQNCVLNIVVCPGDIRNASIGVVRGIEQLKRVIGKRVCIGFRSCFADGDLARICRWGADHHAAPQREAASNPARATLEAFVCRETILYIIPPPFFSFSEMKSNCYKQRNSNRNKNQIAHVIADRY